MIHTRPINAAEQQNFATLVSAIHADRACLMSVYDTRDERPAVLVCAVNLHPDESDPFEFIPLAMLCDDSPYSRFVPPMASEEVTA